jgi:glycogen debranching enzyme
LPISSLQQGSTVAQPKVLCELQGYVYAAKSGMAEIFDALDRHDQASKLRREAADLKRRFNDAFWMEEEGFYAFGLDREKRADPDDRIERGPLPLERDR